MISLFLRLLVHKLEIFIQVTRTPCSRYDYSAEYQNTTWYISWFVVYIQSFMYISCTQIF
jgi:hypothetical protein